ncbi:MAG TPA: hypothetical protein VHD15_07230 [Hyphomicrobiales bacterium]|nr:hypothetical protein [Hyphomicrobiales bacterium]
MIGAEPVFGRLRSGSAKWKTLAQWQAGAGMRERRKPGSLADSMDLQGLAAAAEAADVGLQHGDGTALDALAEAVEIFSSRDGERRHRV